MPIAIEQFQGVAVGADPGKYEVRSKNGANGMSDIEGKVAMIAASEPSRGDASEIDGQTERSNGREHMSQRGQRVSFNYENCDRLGSASDYGGFANPDRS
jgi:hypothetical protein